MPIVAAYLKAITALRIPDPTNAGQPVEFKPADLASGWLIAPVDLGKAGVEPAAYADWRPGARSIERHAWFVRAYGGNGWPVAVAGKGKFKKAASLRFHL
jgi:hypothetical protein